MNEPILSFDRRTFDKKIEKVAQDFQTSLEDGLSDLEAKKRLSEFGPNVLPIRKKLSFLKLFFKQFKDFMVLILVVVSLISFLIHDTKDAIIILIVVIINTFLGFIQEYKAEKTIAALKQTASPNAKVIRDGKYKIIPTTHVVPGDILLIEEGDIIQSDGRICEVVSLATQESFLTGESLPIEKSMQPLREKRVNIADQTNMAFRGSTVARGHGKVIVTATGETTELGKIAHLIQLVTDKPTPLEKKLSGLGKNLVVLTIILCLIIATIGVLRGIPILTMIQIAIVLGVACIPEGLVAVVTMALALGVQRMARKKAIIRRLPAVETLGSVTMICSDKTGTLTEGRMSAQYIQVNNQIISIPTSVNRSEGFFTEKEEKLDSYPEELKLLLMVSVLCNNATLQKREEKSEEDQWEIFGDTTDGALLILGAKASYFKETLQEQYLFIKEAPFDTKRKCMSKIYQITSTQTQVFTKGAPEQILKISTREQINGAILPLLDEKKQKLLKEINAFAGKGYRLLAMAYRNLAASEIADNPITTEKDLIFLGFVAISDPIRKEASASIGKCYQAGIRTMIVTGDHAHTARYIGQQLGIIASEREVGNSQRLEALSPEEFDREIGQYKILSRISPQVKLKIVESLKKQGEIVAMTGDGINDAPAIKYANVGIAMGKTGTDVAKEAADIVLADDNFSTIVSAIEEGRTIYNNILKFIRYLLSCNIGEIFIMFLATLFGLPLPFIPIQILWLNLVTDTPPALALGVEPTDPEMMKHPPRHPKEHIFSPEMIYSILLNGLIMAFITLGIFSFELFWRNSGLMKAQTIAFSTLVLTQVFHAFNCQNNFRSLFSMGLFTNKYLIFAVLTSLALLMISIYNPSLRHLFGLEILSKIDWLYSALSATLIIFSVEIQKKISRSKILKKVQPNLERKKIPSNL